MEAVFERPNPELQRPTPLPRFAGETGGCRCSPPSGLGDGSMRSPAARMGRNDSGGF